MENDKKINYFLMLALVLVMFFSCSEKNDLLQENDNKVNVLRSDSIYVGVDASGEFDYLAILGTGYSAALKKDSTYAWVCVLDSVVPNEKTGVVAYADASGKVQRVVTLEYILNFSHNDDADKIDIFVYNRNDKSSTWVKGIANPYQAYKASRRAGNVLTPTAVVGVLSDIVSGALGGLSGVATSGLGVVNAFGGNTLTTAGVGALSVGLAFATGAGEIALLVAGLKAVIDTGIAGINDMQNHFARELYENAFPVTESYTAVDNTVYLKCRVNGASMNTNLVFNVGIILADGPFITKNHYLQKQSAAYSGDHEYTFTFKVEKNKRYKYRAFLEPSFELGFANVLDYWRYGDVENFMIMDKPVEITAFKQTDSQYKDYGFRYNYINYSYKYEYAVTTKLNSHEEVEDWGYIYIDVQGEKYRCSLMGQNSPATKTGFYYSSVAKSSVTLYEYLKLKDESQVWYGEPQEFDLSHSDTACPDSNHPHWIDLGLPSGTLWRCCNEGASTPEGYGGYYPLGEVASAPTAQQISELVANTSYSCIYQNGVTGGKFTGCNGGAIFLPAAGFRCNGVTVEDGSYGIYWSSTPSGEYKAYGLGFDRYRADWDGALLGDVSGFDIEYPVRPVR